MTRERREEQKKFQEILEKSCTDKIKEEKYLAEKIKNACGEFQKVMNNLRDIKNSLESAKNEFNQITFQIIEKNKEYEAIKAKTELEKKTLDEKSAEISEKERALGQKTGDALEIIKREKETLENKNTILAENIKTDEKILSAIKEEKNIIIQLNKKLENDKVAFSDLQTKHNEEIKEKEAHLAEDKAKFYISQEKEKELKGLEKSLTLKDNALKLKENNLTERETILADKELDMEIRSTELDRQEKRIKNLMEINKK